MANRWWEIRILGVPALEETLYWRLEQFGCKGMASESQGEMRLVRAYIPEIRVQLLDLSALALWLKQDARALGLPTPHVRWCFIDEQDWAKSWQTYWEPQEIGDAWVVYPAWITPPSDVERTIIRLDPGAAFGTGTHPTTQLCLEALEMRLGVGAKGGIFADIGCGSGILSIAALLLNAEKVYAIDIDPLAVKATRNNGLLNHIGGERLVVDCGSIENLRSKVKDPFDGIMCNILAEVVIDLIPHLTVMTKPNGWAILSGILIDQADAVSQTLEKHNWIVGTLWRQEEWCCFNIRRPKDEE